MQVFSTVLFVDGHPVGYRVVRGSEGLVLNPAENPSRIVVAPALSASFDEGTWSVKGTFDQNLIDQVLEDVRNNEGKIPQSVLSAAP